MPWDEGDQAYAELRAEGISLQVKRKRKKASMKTKRPTKKAAKKAAKKPKILDGDIITLHVGPAGIGRQHFKAWFAHEEIDRSDGDDVDVHLTPMGAVVVRMEQLERELLLFAWQETLAVKPS